MLHSRKASMAGTVPGSIPSGLCLEEHVGSRLGGEAALQPGWAMEAGVSHGGG